MPIIRFLDIPDGDPLPREWLFALDSELFESHIALVEEVGPVFAGCKPLKNGLWMLREAIGNGVLAHLVMIEVRNGGLLAIHGFTSEARASITAEIDIADRRRLDLTG